MRSVFRPVLRHLARLALLAIILVAPRAHAKQPAPGHLEIHYIAVGQGGATLIIGPDGTTIMYDFGRVAGKRYLVPYLQHVVGLERGDHIDYAMVSHGDKDHYVGYQDVVEGAGIDIVQANYEPGTDKARSPTMLGYWLDPATHTAAGAFKAIPVGLWIPLGGGAEAYVVAANGIVLNDRQHPHIRNENDRSIALYIRYGHFNYILDGDLGSGRETCTGHATGQLNVQERVARALVKNGLMAADRGVDVMHVAHHGSDSSTSAAYFNLMRPTLALISVGPDQGSFLHPRAGVVERVLLGINRPACVLAPPVQAVLQTGVGANLPCSSTGCTSFAGAPVGNIVLRTDGQKFYTVDVAIPPSAAAAQHIQLSGGPPWTIPIK